MNMTMEHEKSNFKYSIVKKNDDLTQALDLISFHSLLKEKGYKFVRETDTNIILEKLFLRRQLDFFYYCGALFLAFFFKI